MSFAQAEGQNVHTGTRTMKNCLSLLLLLLVAAIGCGEKPNKTGKEKEKPRLKGTGYGDGVIATPIKKKFEMERKIKVDLPVAQALKLYKIENDGKGPQNQKEFEQMLKKHLPTLPKPQEGFYYHWNVKKEEVEFLPVEK